MKSKIGFLFFLSLLFVSKSFETEQVHDRIVYNDTTYIIYSRNLLEASDYPLEPLIWKLYRDTLTRHKLDLFKHPSWCLRGYMAEWEIRNDSLMLIKLKNGHGEEINLDSFFEDRNTKNGVFADWYNFGSLRVIPYGPPYNWYDIKFIAYVFRVHNGIVIFKHKFGNAPTDANGRQVEIIDAGKIYPTINETDCLIWPNNDIKSKAGRDEWDRFGFEPKTGMKGQIISTAEGCSNGVLIYILLINSEFYVPIGAVGVRLL